MNDSQKLLSQIVVYNKYAKFLQREKRRETWDEIVNRYLEMLLKKYKKFPEIEKTIREYEQDLLGFNVLPSMRACQFAGAAIEKNESRIYNCCYLPIEDTTAFSEIMFLLLGGTGVGFSVQKSHVAKLPEILKPTKERKYVIQDSIEGWADAIKALMKAYFGITRYKPRFVYDDIRSKGTRLVTAGGKAPGPDPLRVCITKIEALLNTIPDNSKISPLQAHDIVCHIADSVLAGGIRRAALVSLFSVDDREMATCKHGAWWEQNGQRGRANNSAVFVRGRAKKRDFLDFWKIVKDSGSGEPGIYWTSDPNQGSNPCVEISLRPYSFCNLTEINAGTIKSQEDLNRRAKVASFFGTLQAGFTDFHYLRPVWKINTEKDNLIGVGITGIGNGRLENLNLKEAANVVKKENEKISKVIGIGVASRCTTVKPSGSTSCVLGTSSGIHAWHDEYYIRNMQCGVGDDLYNYFTRSHPSLIKEMDYQPGSAVIGVPQKAPKTAILRDKETALKFLKRVHRFNKEWVHEGHRSGPNTNNVSATCSVKEDEWEGVAEWMWENRNDYNGLSVLPYDGGSYKNAPFESCSEYKYAKLMKYIKNNPIDLTKIVEEEDNTTQRESIACSGGSCEV